MILLQSAVDGSSLRPCVSASLRETRAWRFNPLHNAYFLTLAEEALVCSERFAVVTFTTSPPTGRDGTQRSS
jgi:hypothetical protein